METNKTYHFSNIQLADLQKIVSIRPTRNPNKFEEWFSFPYNLTEQENYFLTDLIDRHYLLLPSYMEEDLKMKFLSPLFYMVNFMGENFHDWYEPAFEGKVNGIKLKGFVDYMVAKGLKTPEKPYFFIQEFKPQQTNTDVEDQLLAEMLVAVEKNQTTIFRGAYIIGQNWRFVILEKIGENKFEYFVSKQFDSLDLPDLKQIYLNLQAVKYLYCKD